MERNYSETLNKAKTYFKNIIKEREKYMQEINLELPKRIEIQTLPLSSSKDNGVSSKVAEKCNKLETKEQNEPENKAISKQNAAKKKSSNHIKSTNVKIESYDLRNMNNNTEHENFKIHSSSNTIIESLSISATDSPISSSVKISTSSSTMRINQKCNEAIEKAKNYFKIKENSKHRNPIQNRRKIGKKNESTSMKGEDDNKKYPDSVLNGDTTKVNTAQEQTKNTKSISQPKKIKCTDEATSAKKYLKSKLGIDQKSINVKKENKEFFTNSKTHVYRISTKIKTFPNARIESKKAVNQKETSRPETSQLVTRTSDEHLTPAKRYLRSKLGIDEKINNKKKDNTRSIHKHYEQDGKSETQPAPQPDATVKPSSKLQKTGSPEKVQQPLSSIRRVPRNRETNLKKLSSANENHKREKHHSKSTSIKDKGALSTKTDIVTNIAPNFRATNKISIELKKHVVLTSSMEELLSKALKIGLKKINRKDLQGLQLKVKASVQSRNNISVLESSINSEKSDLASMQSILESKISDFQTEMEKRQRQTFTKIQELENTIQFRRKQLMEINKTKNMALKKYEK